MASEVVRDRSVRLNVPDLAAFRRELKKMSDDLPKELRALNLDYAEEVKVHAQSSYRSRPGVAPKVAATVKALGQQTGAAVTIGGGSSIGGYVALGVEFGGGKYKAGSPSPRGGYTSQFPAWRGRGPGAGYSLYEAIRQLARTLDNRYGTRLEQLARRAFPD